MTPDDLSTVPPDEFVAARNALVNQLKADGHRGQAAEVAKLRRPAPADWALNVVAHEQPEVVERFLHAAEAGRGAQAAAVEGRAGEDLRGAVGELRAATARLAQAAGKVLSKAGKAAGAVPGRLGEVASSSVLGEQLERRRLGFGGDDVDTDALFAGLEQPATTAEKPARAARPSSKGSASRRESVTTTDARQEREAERARRAERREREKELAAAERAQAAAQAAFDRASARLATAEAEVAKAQAALDDAEQRLADAERAVDETRAALATAD
ncbi:MAG TPA: hypothetical protein VFP08_04830 [Acidimicrobiales bacterium]|nr:hypothetical protein [Acidimicrobiales bacterium]